MTPYSILLYVLIILVSKSVIEIVGKDTIAQFFWLTYIRFSPNKTLNELREKRTESSKVYKERTSISAQDHFAKWTKLNRKYDALQTEISQLEESLSATKTTFSSYIGYAITILTTVSLWGFRLWYRKVPLFYLPSGILPFYIEWLLAFPSAPTGAVGLSAWIFLSQSLFASISFAVKFMLQTPPEKPKEKSI